LRFFRLLLLFSVLEMISFNTVCREKKKKNKKGWNKRMSTL
jgi:hypothetical protein